MHNHTLSSISYSTVPKCGRARANDEQAAVKSFFCYAHFLARQHIPHNTNFDNLVELVVLCGGADLKSFLDRTGGNAVYTSHIAVVEFMEALGTWLRSSYRNVFTRLLVSASWLTSV